MDQDIEKIESFGSENFHSQSSDSSNPEHGGEFLVLEDGEPDKHEK